MKRKREEQKEEDHEVSISSRPPVVKRKERLSERLSDVLLQKTHLPPVLTNIVWEYAQDWADAQIRTERYEQLITLIDEKTVKVRALEDQLQKERKPIEVHRDEQRQLELLDQLAKSPEIIFIVEPSLVVSFSSELLDDMHIHCARPDGEYYFVMRIADLEWSKANAGYYFTEREGVWFKEIKFNVDIPVNAEFVDHDCVGLHAVDSHGKYFLFKKHVTILTHQDYWKRIQDATPEEAEEWIDHYPSTDNCNYE